MRSALACGYSQPGAPAPPLGPIVQKFVQRFDIQTYVYVPDPPPAPQVTSQPAGNEAVNIPKQWM